MSTYIRALLLSLIMGPETASLQETNWGDEEQQFEKHVQLWKSRNVTQYSYLAESNCYDCLWYFPAIVSVSGERVVSIINPDTGAPMFDKTIGAETRTVFPQALDRYLTVEDVFEKIDHALRNHEGTATPGTRMAMDLTAEYDESYGYPVYVSIQYWYGRGVLRKSTDDSFNLKLSQFDP